MAAAAPYAMMGAQVLSGVMGAAGSVAQGNAAYSAAAENARIIGENAGRLRESARITEQQGLTAAERARRKGRILRGNTLAALSISGVDVFEGSPLEILTEQTGQSEYAALEQKFEHDQRAWSMRMQAFDMSQRANMTLRYGGQQRDAAYSNAFAQVVGGATRAGAGAFDLLSTRPEVPGATASPYGGPKADRPD